MSRYKIAILLTALSLSSGHASENKSYEIWKAFPDNFRYGYVVGAMEVIGNILTGSDPYLRAMTLGIHQCMLDLNPTQGVLISLVDGYYESHPDKDIAPALALTSAINDICIDQINSVRIHMGLKELQPDFR